AMVFIPGSGLLIVPANGAQPAGQTRPADLFEKERKVALRAAEVVRRAVPQPGWRAAPATGSDAPVHLRDVPPPRERQLPPPPSVRVVSLPPDGKVLAIQGRDGTVKYIDAEKIRQAVTYTLKQGKAKL